jgi:hypothetical protein
MSLTITSTKVDAASDSAEDIFAALNTHFGASSQFDAILPTPTTDHTIYIEPAGSEPWRFALSTIGAPSTALLAGSMEPDKATAPDGLDPSSGATAEWSGQSDRLLTNGRTRFMLVTEITGEGRDAVFVHFYTDNAGVRAYPFKDTLHFGRTHTPLFSEIPGLDGLGLLSGLGKWRSGTTTTASELVARATSVGRQLGFGRMRIGPTAWNMFRWPAPGYLGVTTNNLLQGRRALGAIPCGSNDATGVDAAAHNETPALAAMNHLVMWHTNLVAGAKIEDTTNGRAWMCIGDSTTTTPGAASTHNQILARVAVGFDPAP